MNQKVLLLRTDYYYHLSLPIYKLLPYPYF